MKEVFTENKALWGFIFLMCLLIAATYYKLIIQPIKELKEDVYEMVIDKSGEIVDSAGNYLITTYSDTLKSTSAEVVDSFQSKVNKLIKKQSNNLK
ncbi:MAG: hypothetical protein J5I47_07895 [Vicingus serpentipes]|nr:hypothetical protein [Vicingus serpentipes]